jgi:hypothetical protein
MTRTCEALRPLVAARASALLEPGESTELDAHLGSCEACRALALTVERGLEVTVPEPRALPAGGWDRLARAIEADRAGRSVVALRVTLACTFCHADLRRDEAAFCAGCLAPHHPDCFESHGRCSAPGCGETRTVEPRERRPRRFPLIALAFALAGGGAVAALTGRSSASRLPAVAEKPAPPGPAAPPAPPLPLEQAVALTEAEPTPYPWPELEAFRDDERLGALMTVDREGSLAAVASALAASSGRKLLVEPEIAQAPVALHLHGVTVKGALLLLADLVPGATLGLRPDGGLVIGRCEGLDCKGEILADEDGPPDLTVPAIGGKVFADTPLEECVAWLASATGVNILLASDVPTMPATGFFLATTPLGTVLETLETRTPLVVLARHGAVVLEPRRSQVTSRVHVDAAITGSIAELVRALRDRGLPCVATPEAWRSRGKRDHMIHEETLADLARRLESEGLRVQLDSRHPGLLVDGTIPTARDALTGTVPAGWTGVAVELAEARNELTSSLRQVRSRETAAGFPLEQRISAVCSIVECARSLATAPERLAAKKAERESVRGASRDSAAELDRLTLEREALESKSAGPDLERLALIEMETQLWYPTFVARNKEERERHEEVLRRLAGRTEPEKLDERYREEDRWIDHERREPNERRMRFDRLREAQAKYPPALDALRVAAMRVSNSRRRLEIRERELDGEIDRIERELPILERVQLGGRLREPN